MIKSFIPLLFLIFSLHGSTIQIICMSNEVGLTRDTEILTEELTRLGHQVIQIKNPKSLHHFADINIFLEQIWPGYFLFAKKNYLIPNPEWTGDRFSLIRKCDLILCRTQDTLRIFSDFNTYFLNFTSHDQFEPGIAKEYSHPFHSVGKSIYKGTASVLKVWQKRPDFPLLTFTTGFVYQNIILPNVETRFGLLPREEYRVLQNRHGIHLCPSQAEGFGHYIIEAMSTGAVVLTTDAPPMNEYIDDPRLKVKVLGAEKCNFGSLYTIDEEDLEQKIENLLQMSQEEYGSIGQRNRQFFLAMQADFRARLKELFGEDHGSDLE